MKWFHVFLLFFVVFVWGINFVFVKMALDAVPPLFLCFLRFFLLSLFGIPFFKFRKVPLKWVALYGFVMFTVQFALVFLGIEAGVSSGIASLLLQTQVFFSLLFAKWFFKERLTRWQILGAATSFSGIAVIFLNLGSGISLSGLLFILSAAITWGSGSVIVKKMGPIESRSLLAWGSLFAWPPLLAASLFFENSLPLLLSPHHFSQETIGAILFITLGSTGFGFGVWNWLVQLYPIGTIAPFTLLVPLFGMLSSVFFLDEPLQLWKIGSALLVVGGLCCIFLGPRFNAVFQKSSSL